MANFPGSVTHRFPQARTAAKRTEILSISGLLQGSQLARHRQPCPGTLTTASLSYSSTTTRGGDSASSFWGPCSTRSLNSSIWFQVGERVWEMTWEVGPEEKQQILQLGCRASERRSVVT